MKLGDGRKVSLNDFLADNINTTTTRTDHMTQLQKDMLKNDVLKYPKLFSAPDEKLTCTTKILGEIRTRAEDPIYSKTYPYPITLK